MIRPVIDASVAVKWVIEEEGSALASRLQGVPCLAPDLISAECANILWKKVRRGEITGQEALLASRALAIADVTQVPMQPHRERAMVLALTLDHPAYDCFYLAVAEDAGSRLVTADARFLNRMRQQPDARLSGLVWSLAEAARQIGA